MLKNRTFQAYGNVADNVATIDTNVALGANNSAQRFLAWCGEAQFGGLQPWPMIAWEYHEYLLATNDLPITDRQLQRELGAVCRKKVRPIRPGERDRIHRLRRLLHSQGWAVPGCEKSATPRVMCYEIPSATSH